MNRLSAAKPSAAPNTLALSTLQMRALAMILLAALVAHGGWLRWTLLGYLVSVIALRLVWQQYSPRTPPQWVRLPLFVLTLALVYSQSGTPISRDGGVALLIGLATLKLVETDSVRDARMLIAALFFLSMTAFLFSQSALLTLWVGAVTVAAFAGLSLLRKYPESRGQAGRVVPEMIAAVRAAGRSAAAAIPLVLVAFVFFPRLGQPLWGAPWDPTQGRTGLGDEMRPGMLSKLWDDDTPVFRVTFDGETPTARDLYWRGPVLDQFDGKAWTRGDAFDRYDAIDFRYEPASVVDYEVLLEATERVWYFPLDLPLKAAPKSRLLIDGQMIAHRPIITPRRLQMQSATRFVFDAQARPAEMAFALRLPARSNPRARELARHWREQGMDDRQIVDAALTLFHQSFSYTLEPPPLAPDRSVDEFLFDTKIGYCEHFSSAFTFLMRASGIPARVVTGYLGGYRNSSGNYLVVRNSDAHAWSEVWMEGRGWIRVDPTSAVAPERIDRGSIYDALPEAALWYQNSWLTPLMDRFDVASRWWRQRVIDFDAQRQRDLLSTFGVQDTELKDLVLLLIVGGALALSLGIWWSLHGLGYRSRDPLLTAWQRFGRQLERRGVTRAEHEGPIDFSRRAARLLPSSAGDILQLGREFARLRYDPNSSVSAKQQHDLLRRLRRFRAPRKGGARP